VPHRAEGSRSHAIYVRRGQTDPRAAWARIPLEEFCALYRRNAARAASAASTRPSAVRLLSYEAFTADPEAELRAACEFVGEPPDPGLLSGFDVEEAKIAHWEGSSLLYSKITTTTKNWRDYLSERDARRVEELLEPELARFGYARATR
jgi:hypothetical protein